MILKAREPARILIAIGGDNQTCPHLEYKQRWVDQSNFCVNDQDWGTMFVGMCPYFPFSARICLNQHNWLAVRMRQEERVPHTRRLSARRQGYSICVVFLKLFERVYAPLTAGLLKPFGGDRKMPEHPKVSR